MSNLSLEGRKVEQAIKDVASSHKTGEVFLSTLKVAGVGNSQIIIVPHCLGCGSNFFWV